MKFDLAPNPDPLPFGKGDKAFKLRLKPCTGEERMAILDAARSDSLCSVQVSVDRLVIGWEGVVDAAGNPVPLEYQEDGITKKRFNAFLGAISCEMHIRVLAGILAFVDIPTGDIDQVVKIFGNTEEAKPDTAPTAPPGDATPATASGG